MGREFAARELIRSTPEHVFDFVADYRNVGPILEGVKRWEPTTGQTQGVGATFKVEMSALGIPLGDLLELDRWDRPRAIGWKSIGGIMPQTGRWRFTPRRAGVQVELKITYFPPGGFFGERLAATLDSIVRHRLERALERMRDRIESAEKASA